MKKLRASTAFLSLKRKSRLYTRKFKKKRNMSGSLEIGRLKVKYHSKILDSLSMQFGGNVKSTGHKIKLVVPKAFSIIDNPQESLEKIRELVLSVRGGLKTRKIVINHTDLESIDLAAETLLGYCVFEFDKERKGKTDKILIQGNYPDNPYLRKYLKATGIIKNLEVEHEYLDKDEENELKIFRKTNGRHTQQDDVGHSDFKENTVAQFALHLNECLETNSRRLTEIGSNLLTTYIGEIIGNAEEHPSINRWAIYGYLDNSENGSNMCEIAIFNFGGSIADSFKLLSKDSYAYKQVRPYIDRHKKGGLFDENWTEDALLTLIALQGGVSSKNQDETSDSGQGTIDAISFFQKISEECNQVGRSSTATMAILSGRTHVLFDGRYALQKDVNDREVIAFNRENSLDVRPDSNYIRLLKNINFPGTVISIRFPIEKTGTLIR